MSTKKNSGAHNGGSRKRKVGQLIGNGGSNGVNRLLYRCGRCRGPVSAPEAVNDGMYKSHPRCVKRSVAA